MMDDVGIFIIEIDPIYSHDTPSPAPPLHLPSNAKNWFTHVLTSRVSVRLVSVAALH